MACLENWGLAQSPMSLYHAPELAPVMLVGTVTGHPRLRDGAEIRTSPIVDVEEVNGNLVATTQSGTRYELGVVHPDYERLYPGAVDRILKIIK